MTTALPSGTPENQPTAQPVAALLAEMVLQYAQRDASQALNDWLADTLVQRTGAKPEAARETAHSITSYLQDSHTLRADLRAHVDKGKSRSSWIASQIERIASDHQASPADVAALSELLSGQASAEGPPAAPRDWNDISRIAFAKDLEQQQLLHTAGTVLEDGARQWANSAVDVWLKEQPQSAALAQKLLRGELDVQSATGLQATLAIATDIATRQGLLGSEMHQASKRGELIPEWFAQNTFIGTENARTLYAVGTGELDANDAIDRMAETATASLVSTTRVMCRKIGGELGHNLGKALGAKIPFLAPFAAPLGRKVGEFLGDTVGRLAGSAASKVIHQGVELAKSGARAVVSAAKSVVQGVGNAVRSVASWLGF
ncbi:MAG: hypothetical protein PHU77_08325 [Simplicispira sp.]|nr:hypothetical protein [Simplicispira sp.]